MSDWDWILHTAKVHRYPIVLNIHSVLYNNVLGQIKGRVDSPPPPHIQYLLLIYSCPMWWAMCDRHKGTLPHTIQEQAAALAMMSNVREGAFAGNSLGLKTPFICPWLCRKMTSYLGNKVDPPGSISSALAGRMWETSGVFHIRAWKWDLLHWNMCPVLLGQSSWLQ